MLEAFILSALLLVGAFGAFILSTTLLVGVVGIVLSKYCKNREDIPGRCALN